MCYIFQWLDPVSLCSFKNAEYHGAGNSSILSIAKQEVLAADNKRFYAAFRNVVADKKSSVQKESCKLVPKELPSRIKSMAIPRCSSILPRIL